MSTALQMQLYRDNLREDPEAWAEFLAKARQQSQSYHARKRAKKLEELRDSPAALRAFLRRSAAGRRGGRPRSRASYPKGFF